MTPRNFVKLMCLVGLAAIAAAADNNDAPVRQVLRGSDRRLDIKKGINWCQDNLETFVGFDASLGRLFGPCPVGPDPVTCVWNSTPCKGDCLEDKCTCEGGSYLCFSTACEYSPGGEPEAEREKCPDPPTPAPAGGV